jgi:small subunit ribosomal protein S8
MTDPISDLISRIKNANLARLQEVVAPHSKMAEAVVKILVANNYLAGYSVKEMKPQSELVVQLKYVAKQPVITDIKRTSKPGQRIYAGVHKLPRVLNGYGLSIISTSKGVLSSKEAKTLKVGGEVICQIW